MKGFIIKEFRHIFRDVRTMIILFGMPIVQILLFGFAITTEIKDAKIAIWDPSKDESTRRITEKLTSSGYFRLERNVSSYEEIDEVFKEGKIKMVLIFSNDFSKTLLKEQSADIQILADASDPNAANLLVNYAIGIIKNYQLELMALNPQKGMIDVESKMLFNQELKSVYMFVPGIITVLLMLVCAMMTSISIAREKELGTMEILLVSPLKPAQIIIGKVAPYILLSFINAVVILTLGYFVFGTPINGSVILLMLEIILFILLGLSLGILISTIANTQQVALLVSLAGLMLPTILLSGFIFPIENMPEALQIFSNIIPTRWFLIIIKTIMLKGVGFFYLWKETLIILGMTLFFILLSVKNFKIRLE